MNWKLTFYDWYGFNIELFQMIYAETPTELIPIAWVFSIAGSYWFAPVPMLLLWSQFKSANHVAHANKIRRRLIVFCTAFLLATLLTSISKLWLDFPRPPVVLGELVRVTGEADRHFSLPSGHATYIAVLAASLWPILGKASRIGLLMLSMAIGWSRIALGAHFPADVVAGFTLGCACVVAVSFIVSRVSPKLTSRLAAT